MVKSLERTGFIIVIVGVCTTACNAQNHRSSWSTSSERAPCIQCGGDVLHDGWRYCTPTQHGIAEALQLEGASGDRLVQPPCSEQDQQEQVAQDMF